MGRHNERLERLVAGARELLRTVNIAVGGLREDARVVSGISATLLDALQGEARAFATLMGQIIDKPAALPSGSPTPPRRRGPGRPRRLLAAGPSENYQGGTLNQEMTRARQDSDQSGSTNQ